MCANSCDIRRTVRDCGTTITAVLRRFSYEDLQASVLALPSRIFLLALLQNSVQFTDQHY